MIKAVHITELRTALNAARSALSLSALTYTDPTLTTGSTTVKAAHLTELRAGTQWCGRGNPARPGTLRDCQVLLMLGFGKDAKTEDLDHQ